MIEQVIREYWEAAPQAAIDRDYEIDLKSDLINDIVGIRRSGKTFLMFNIISKLTQHADKRSVIYINFENRKLLPLKKEYFNDIIKFIYSEKLIEKHGKVYLFLDEVQRFDGWEKFARSIYDEFKGKIKIFISGSSANLLSKDYGKLLTGRHLTTTVFPLSFKEFLRFKNLSIGDITEKKMAEIDLSLNEYMRYGGFPEVVLLNNKEALLNQLFSDILAKDVAGRGDLRKEGLMEEFAYYLASNASNTLSFNKMANYFKSSGIKVSVQTLENYFHLMKNSFLFFDNTVFSYKVKDQLLYPRKIYCVDTGLANLVGFKFTEDYGKLFENIVAVELLRRSSAKPTVKIFYWKGKLEKEVDFVIKDGLKIRELIQVCKSIDDEKTKKREVGSLLEAMKEFDLRCGLIITEKYEADEKIEGKTIRFMPLWKWLLTDK